LRWVPARPSARARRILSLWHQDGSFLGRDIRAVNVWTALTACGADAPSLEFSVKGAAVRPELDAGDAVLFDHLTQHRTHMSAQMTSERYGIECWFFAPSTFPMRQVPLVF
jgi:hypothetical protein